MFTLDTDFSELDTEGIKEYMMDFGNILEDAFYDEDDEHKLLGHLMIMSRFINTSRHALDAQHLDNSPGIQKAYDIIWDYVEGKVRPIDFERFTNMINGFCLSYTQTKSCRLTWEVFDKYITTGLLTSIEFMLLQWCVLLLLALVRKDGWHIKPYDYDGPDEISFGFMGQVLYKVFRACAVVSGIPVPSYTDTDAGYDPDAEELFYSCPLIADAVCGIRGDLLSALGTDPSQYARLRNECRSRVLLPDKFAAKLPLDLF